MPSLQRRRGERALVFAVEKKVDRRSNDVQMAVSDEPLEVTAAFIPDRSARAEVPGQMHIDVYTMVTKADLTGVNIWSRVAWRGRMWDMVAPPALHVGDRHTHHWTCTIRARVDDGGLVPRG